MSAIFESRLSDSLYIEIIWRGHVEQDYAPVCPADVRWNLLFTRHGSRIRVSAEGVEFLVIKFRLGVFMPDLPARIFQSQNLLAE